jgi:hypothetical protein
MLYSDRKILSDPATTRGKPPNKLIQHWQTPEKHKKRDGCNMFSRTQNVTNHSATIRDPVYMTAWCIWWI